MTDVQKGVRRVVRGHRNTGHEMIDGRGIAIEIKTAIEPDGGNLAGKTEVLTIRRAEIRTTATKTTASIEAHRSAPATTTVDRTVTGTRREDIPTDTTTTTTTTPDTA